MAHQLLTGRFPFDDKRNPGNPSISKIWWALPFALAFSILQTRLVLYGSLISGTWNI